ncbi:CxxH/CxxC protein [Marininema halotolerans]|uniref:CxxH/CxxC protein, BA_5709 family n=1 Tax=Marininema halotolerans TaxID=1155944 RepID=A0A1I6P9D6_9BACL|nr:CxxH/CxxC protein [Marininema halotolerans]SFS36789.1 CxxH/CxxC protein, BA_5709 family [Marininema halotolerans]
MAGTHQTEPHSITWYACNEHIEVVLDQLVDEAETAPDLFPCEPEELGTATCHWCGSTPSYRLSAQTNHE